MCDFSELTKLIAECQGRLLRYAEHFLHDAAAAQDAVQNAYLKYVRYVRTKHISVDNPSAWLFKATRNCCLDTLRSSYEKLKAPIESTEDEEVCGFSPFGNPSDSAMNNDDLALVREVINSLPEREREILTLKFEESLSYREISDMTGLTVNHIGNILHRAIAKIKAACAERNSAGRRK